MQTNGAMGCQIFVEEKLRQAMIIFRDTTHNEVQKRKDLSVLFQQAVDLDWIGKTVMGPYWRDASGADQKRFLEHYRTYVTSSYISKFNDEDSLGIEDMKILSITPQEPG